MPNWLPENNLLGTVVAAVALCLSIVNFIRTSRVSDRQFRQSYYQEVNEWAVDVMRLFDEISLCIEVEKSAGKDVSPDAMKAFHRRIVDVMRVGVLLFGGVDKENIINAINHPVLRIVYDTAEYIKPTFYMTQKRTRSLDDPSMYFAMANLKLMQELTEAFALRHRFSQAAAPYQAEP